MLSQWFVFHWSENFTSLDGIRVPLTVPVNHYSGVRNQQNSTRVLFDYPCTARVYTHVYTLCVHGVHGVHGGVHGVHHITLWCTRCTPCKMVVYMVYTRTLCTRGVHTVRAQLVCTHMCTHCAYTRRVYTVYTVYTM